MTTPAEQPVAQPSAPAGPFVPSARSISPWTTRQKFGRVLWMFTRATLFRWSFHNWYAWRVMLLRLFGAKLGHAVRIRPTVSIEIPWNLEIGDDTGIGDHAILYSLGKITLGRHVSISQYTHLCAGTHDYTTDAMTLLCPPITVGDEVWIAADAFIGPGVAIGARSVIAARSTVVKDVPSDQVVGGNPAKFIKPRVFRT
ncbi:MAG TPA: WcaF family extracellular polysaccharide biosynthesis acetyltransferase [Tepidisphaeraceae bacterium]|nr:WcaF family extracellular polysaccharide biosynthesis acetyltransferase [Tepidisphaeraceae bacterium]